MDAARKNAAVLTACQGLPLVNNAVVIAVGTLTGYVDYLTADKR